MLTEAQLKMRKTGLGGSDIAAALGHSPWKTPLQLWAEKTDPEYRSESNGPMEWGNRLESAVYAKFHEEHPELSLSHSGGTVRHEEYSFLLATPDGFIVDDGEGGILEVKTSGQHPWDEVPAHYLLQVQHYMYVLNKSFAYFAVLFRGNQYREYGPIYHDREDYEMLILPELEEFWRCVEANDPTFEPSDISDLSYLYTLKDDTEMLATVEQITTYAKLCELQQAVKVDGDNAKALKFELAQSMGENKKLVDTDGKTLVNQYDISDSIVVDVAKVKADKKLFADYQKTKKGYRVVRVY